VAVLRAIYAQPCSSKGVETCEPIRWPERPQRALASHFLRLVYTRVSATDFLAMKWVALELARPTEPNPPAPSQRVPAWNDTRASPEMANDALARR
jgi:hypothetical protein